VTTYGVSFIQRDDDRYFTVPGKDADTGKFIIEKERPDDKREVSFIPSVFFSWGPCLRQPFASAGQVLRLRPQAGRRRRPPVAATQAEPVVEREAAERLPSRRGSKPPC
jgi:hypothetical protein